MFLIYKYKKDQRKGSTGFVDTIFLPLYKGELPKSDSCVQFWHWRTSITYRVVVVRQQGGMEMRKQIFISLEF
jgi:hypothetical protein